MNGPAARLAARPGRDRRQRSRGCADRALRPGARGAHQRPCARAARPQPVAGRAHIGRTGRIACARTPVWPSGLAPGRRRLPRPERRFGWPCFHAGGIGRTRRLRLGRGGRTIRRPRLGRRHRQGVFSGSNADPGARAPVATTPLPAGAVGGRPLGAGGHALAGLLDGGRDLGGHARTGACAGGRRVKRGRLAARPGRSRLWPCAWACARPSARPSAWPGARPCSLPRPGGRLPGRLLRAGLVSFDRGCTGGALAPSAPAGPLARRGGVAVRMDRACLAPPRRRPGTGGRAAPPRVSPRHAASTRSRRPIARRPVPRSMHLHRPSTRELPSATRGSGPAPHELVVARTVTVTRPGTRAGHADGARPFNCPIVGSVEGALGHGARPGDLGRQAGRQARRANVASRALGSTPRRVRPRARVPGTLTGSARRRRARSGRRRRRSWPRSCGAARRPASDRPGNRPARPARNSARRARGAPR